MRPRRSTWATQASFRRVGIQAGDYAVLVGPAEAVKQAQRRLTGEA